MDRTRGVTLLLLLVATGCSTATDAAARPSASPAPYVATTVVKNGAIHPSLEIAGVVTPFRQVGIAANLNEPIAEVYVQEGDRVRAGQPLARLMTDDLEAQLASAQRITAEDIARYKQTAYQTTATNAQDVSAVRTAQNTLRQAQVSLSGAMTDLKRYEALEAQGYLAPQTVDQQRTTVATDTAAVNNAQAALNQALAAAQANGSGNTAGVQQAALESARETADAAQATVEQIRRQVARAAIVSPVDGIVDAVNANPGEYPSSRQLFTIEQTASVYALLPTSTADVVQIPTGSPASVVVAGSSHTDRGKVVAVLDQLIPGSTNFTVKVLVSNPDGHLHAGMPVSGELALPPVRGLEIPVSAFIDDTKSSVYTVEKGVAKAVDVHDVRDDGNNAIVTGLRAGTRIVSNVNSANVGNGDRVSLQPPSGAGRRSRRNPGS